MNREELLNELALKINSGELSREEVASFVGLKSTNFNTQTIVSTEPAKIKPRSFFSVNKILYLLGTAVVVIGFLIFFAQIWEDIGSFGRIFLTLGLGLFLALLGSLLLKSKPEENLGAVFHFIAGIIIPCGAIVTLDELIFDDISPWLVCITFGIICIFYLLLNYVHKNAILTLFAIANGTAFIYMFVEAIYKNNIYDTNVYTYTTMLIGISYLLLAYDFRGSRNKSIVKGLYFFGSLGFLGAIFSLMLDNDYLELPYFLIVFGGIALSVYMKSRIILILSTLFLIIHVSYITDKYFAESLGWPLSLVLLGFVFIGLGYFSVNINKKYIAN